VRVKGRELRKDEDKYRMALHSCLWMAGAQGPRYRGGIAEDEANFLR
jgi:hypothetical protein